MAANPTTRGHHPWSPSKLNYLEASPCWSPIEQEASALSLAGTAQHEAVDADTLSDDLTDVQAEAVVSCQRYFDALVEKYPGGQILNEIYLPVDRERVIDSTGKAWLGTTAGYLDRCVVSADCLEAELCDWKFGAWSVVDAKTNLQGIAYLLGLVNLIPTLQAVTVHFVMPHRNEVTNHRFSRPDFESLLLRVKATVRRAEEFHKVEDLTRCRVTNSTCIFCANIGRCPLVAAHALQVGKKFAPMKTPSVVDPLLLSDPGQAGIALDFSGLLSAWAKGVRAIVADKALNDEKWIPTGYVLKQRSKTEIVNTERVLELAKSYGSGDGPLEEAWRLSLTGVVEAVRAVAPRGSKDDREVTFRQQILTLKLAQKTQPTTFLEKIKT